jgi:hypothetical protein
MRARSKTAILYFARKNPTDKRPFANWRLWCPNLSVGYDNKLKILFKNVLTQPKMAKKMFIGHQQGQTHFA